MKEKDAGKIGGHSTTAFAGPLAGVLLLLMIAIVLLLLRVNRNTNIHTRMMQDSGNYQQEVTDIQAGASLLTETAGNFALMPLGEDGSVNVGPLMAFAQELGGDRRGPQVAERFRQYEVSREALGFAEESASYTEQLLEVQLHVLSLMRSVYPLPPVPALSAIPEIPLTREELDLSPEERTDYARSLILNTDYTQLRFHLNEVIVQCHKTIQEDFTQASQEIAGHIRTLRTAASCINECFNKGDNCSCYRIGGDEFAAVIKGCTEAEIHSCLGHFAWTQERENISVSVGCARAENVLDPGFRALMSQADQHMYEQKKCVHADGAVR